MVIVWDNSPYTSPSEVWLGLGYVANWSTSTAPPAVAVLLSKPLTLGYFESTDLHPFPSLGGTG